MTFLIFSKTPEEHAEHLETVLQILEREGLYAKLKKCDFKKAELLYLGHMLSREGIEVDPAKISCIAEWPIPKNVHELRSFLGLANYFRRFVPAYSVRAAPMTKLTGKNTPWNWSSQCQDAFTGLKADLTNSPVLAYPDITKHFEVVIDACCEGIGAVLIQEGQPVAYLSRKLQGAELNYTTTEQELLASITAMRTWRCFLEVDTDIAEWIQVCPPCQRNKGNNRLPAGELQPLPVPEQRWSDVSMDVITHLPRTRSGHTSICVVVDRLSKLAHFISTVDTATAEDVARLFIDNIFFQHGMPRRIDRDTRFLILG